VISLLSFIKYLIFIVRSSSFDKVEVDNFKLGLIQTGGTGKSCTIKSLTLVPPDTLTNNHYLCGILCKTCKASQGLS
jgi:hypothetical protein